VNDGAWRWSGAGTTDLGDGVWHYVVGMYDGANVQVWVDGVQENSAPLAAATLQSSTDPVLIGNWEGAGGDWEGMIDDFKIYDRALSSAEIQFNYTNFGGAPATNLFIAGMAEGSHNWKVRAMDCQEQC